MTSEELFDDFYSVIKNGTGKECVEYFNSKLSEAKGDISKLRFILSSIHGFRYKDMRFEEQDIFRTFEKILLEEIKGLREE